MLCCLREATHALTWYRHSTRLSDSRTHVDWLLSSCERSAMVQAM
jgi:hypothetical protein